ncbi:MAG: hypothetical protein A2172_00755 [Candidatus Woykebacteria bacterium RBG_13_40_15]|uniref:DUF304 domain-containing protein n=1 Tax=Candidatus Woykebacteria bacterium RBG_13_40_15 TaxID=1802593 RepID=A0A1G1W932_9BACT|nr:MAG: hypothetical protein A2172_00755 [Candidatus Woykebacteria bacterium RBG_13_40_15]
MAGSLQEPARFEGELKEEKVLFLLRPHIITNLKWVLIAAFLAALPIIIPFLPNILGFNLQISASTSLLAFLTWELIVLGASFQYFLFWYFNIYILTNKRIVDINFYSIFYHKVSQMALQNVQDVTYSKGGIAQNFFDYGDVHIQTAGTLLNFDFLGIPDPEGNVKKILDLVSDNKKAEGRYENRTIQPN